MSEGQIEQLRSHFRSKIWWLVQRYQEEVQNLLYLNSGTDMNKMKSYHSKICQHIHSYQLFEQAVKQCFGGIEDESYSEVD